MNRGQTNGRIGAGNERRIVTERLSQTCRSGREDKRREPLGNNAVHTPARELNTGLKARTPTRRNKEERTEAARPEDQGRNKASDSDLRRWQVADVSTRQAEHDSQRQNSHARIHVRRARKQAKVRNRGRDFRRTENDRRQGSRPVAAAGCRLAPRRAKAKPAWQDTRTQSKEKRRRKNRQGICEKQKRSRDSEPDLRR